jgi:UDP-N-acetylglucosamine--N-acetylmuramyl-(pentapeptide) pyrophosphoryl-undecaprenol N-acetylglucosamine transferase
VPYPYAADDHQRHNAQAVADGGAAVMILDAEIDDERIADVVEELAGDPERRAGMAAAARRLAVPGAAARIADVVDEFLGLEEGGVDVP